MHLIISASALCWARKPTTPAPATPPNAVKLRVTMRLSRRFLLAELEVVAKSFRKNELAYLSMTGGIENPIRDRLAWSLHSHLYETTDVIREWKRRDIALFPVKKPKEPSAIIELKSMSLGGNRYLQLVDDLEAARCVLGAPRNIKRLGLLLVTFTHDPTTTRHRHIAKNFGMRNRPHMTGRPSTAVRGNARSQLRDDLKDLDFAVTGPRPLEGGRAFCIRLTVDCWALEPTRP